MTHAKKTKPPEMTKARCSHDALVVADPSQFDNATTAAQLNQQYAKAQAGALEMIRFGAMIGALELEMEGPRDGRKAKGLGLKGWLEEHCPEIAYRTAMTYRELAKGAAAQLQCESVARLSEALAVGEMDGATDEDRELYEEVRGLVFGKSARQLLFSFGEARRSGRPKGSKNEAPYKPITTAEYEEMATVELEGIVRDLGNFIGRHMHLKIQDVERRKACRLRLQEMADVLK